MKIGIGLPNTTPGATGRLILDWSRRAEERGFSSLATIDRVAYPNFDSLTTLAAAGAVTERIGLLTNILLATTRSTALLAKEAQTVDQVSNGRLTLGLGVGGRRDDFDLSGLPMRNRGARFDRMLPELRDALAGKPIGDRPVTPPPVREGGPPVVIGGMSDEALRRTAEFGIGWTAGGAPADVVLPFVQRVREAWQQSGRPGGPYIYALSYFSLGDEHIETSKHSITDYYGYLGEAAVGFAEHLPRSPEALRSALRQYEDAGVDELIWDPTVPDLDQVDLLADAVLG